MSQKYVIPGDRKVTHGKPYADPRLRCLSLEEARKRGIPISDDLVISPMPRQDSKAGSKEN